MDDDKDRRNGKNNTLPFIFILILSLVVLAVGVYFGLQFLHRSENKEENSHPQESGEMIPDGDGELEGPTMTEGMTEQTMEAEPLSEAEEPELSESSFGVQDISATQDSAEAQDSEKKAMVLDVSDVVKVAMPSVVAITNISVQEVEYVFRGTMSVESQSSGSGIIIAQNDEELLIATNYHVIENATALTVCFSVDAAEEEEAVAEAVVKGSDEQYDLAVVSVKLEDISEEVFNQITVASLGTSSDLEVGEPAIAIGNALGYGQSVTLGIVSALDRVIEIDGYSNTYIQTDAAINFGNSGGALLNVDGEVIGINSAKAASSGVEGMGYAIPIDEAQAVLEVLMNRETREKVEESERGYLGAYTQDISSEARSLYDIPNGVYVYQVAGGSAAEEAGLKRGDIISKFDGISITATDMFEDLLEYYRVGETITMEVLVADMGSYTATEMEVTFTEQPEQNSSNAPGGRPYGFGTPFG